MTRLHYVKKARKTIRGTGVKKGMPYYWWKFKRDDKRRVSLTRPPRSALTQSPFLASMMDLEDQFNAIDWESQEPDLCSCEMERIADDVENLKAEIEAALEGIQDHFPNGCPTAELLEDRRDQLDAILEDLRDRSLDEDGNGGTERPNVDWNYG